MDIVIAPVALGRVGERYTRLRMSATKAASVDFALERHKGKNMQADTLVNVLVIDPKTQLDLWKCVVRLPR